MPYQRKIKLLDSREQKAQTYVDKANRDCWPRKRTIPTKYPVLIDIQGNYTVTLIEGDGIGPEISQAVKDIFAAAKVGIESWTT
jgi:hypothetical protein